MPAIHVRKYNTAAGTGTKIGMQHTKAGLSDFATNSDWSPAAGDVKVSIDEAAEANIGTLPSYSNGWWIYTFTGGETTGKSIRVRIVDTAPKAINDDYFEIETDGNASAMWPPDYANATNFNLTNLDATISSRSTYAGGDTSGVTTLLTRVPAAITVLSGRIIGELSVHNGTAQAGGVSTITLAAGASAVTDFYKNKQIVLLGGTGAGQTNTITAYNGTTKVATVKNAWGTNPDATTTYSIEAYTAAVSGQVSTLLGLP